ncbi:carboxylesterase/lipase family protein [Notoacmeibacter ruber]|uniref:Carboxylic ester hydrolase n=1 Tax=Notoacmeibacter ruber TaxID=2670375 RepID=A0A3L7J7X0_9HYPH|nr:carboxylesterase/lipase family protein [Notoacmeibacter ruber]RLQ86827.1 carboxylesterase family protein [Notoacmeibacter ruber]
MTETVRKPIEESQRQRWRRFFLALSWSIGLSACAAPGAVHHIVKSDAAQHHEVTTDRGVIRGTSAPEGSAFLGIPFSAPPVGPLRFAPPQPAAAWAGVRDATKLRASCPQLVPAREKSEDCLYLNVYTPADIKAGDRLPVLVWLYGGGLSFGSNEQYDGSRLAQRRNVVVVVPNYRLGALGFFAHPLLRGPDEGNYGLLDQRAALEWVQRNIEPFGGDPSRVTLFGESAGATSACTHMVSPGSRGLFHRIILQSDTCIFPEQWISRAGAEAGGIAMARDLGCNGADALTCLRDLPVGELVKAKSHRWGNVGRDSWSPMVGGEVLPDKPRTLFARGQDAPVPLLMGSNRDEGRLFANLLSLTLAWTSRKGYEREVGRAIRSDILDEVLGEYADEAERSYYHAYADIITDSRFACPMLSMHRLRAGRAADYVYEFDDPNARSAAPRVPFTPSQGSYHAAELPYVFGHRFLFASPDDWSAEQAELSDRIQRYWTAFAASGQPDVDGLADWPTFDSENPLRLSPEGESLIIDFAARHRCEFWNSMGY